MFRVKHKIGGIELGFFYSSLFFRLHACLSVCLHLGLCVDISPPQQQISAWMAYMFWCLGLNVNHDDEAGANRSQIKIPATQLYWRCCWWLRIKAWAHIDPIRTWGCSVNSQPVRVTQSQSQNTPSQRGEWYVILNTHERKTTYYRVGQARPAIHPPFFALHYRY